MRPFLENENQNQKGAAAVKGSQQGVRPAAKPHKRAAVTGTQGGGTAFH